MDLIAAYLSSDDSSDEEEPRPKRRHTGDHSEQSTTTTTQPPTIPPPLPPPPLLEPMCASTAEDGRVRQFAHVDGQFAVHVYLPVRLDPRPAADLRQCLRLLEAEGAHAVPQEELHVSLSRTFTLGRPQLEGFDDALRRALRQCATVHAPLDSTVVELTNDTRTRFFAAMELRRGTEGHAAVCALIDAVDGVVERYGQTRFYEERRLHLSVAWALAPFCAPLPSLPANVTSSQLKLDCVAWRIGERVNTFRLPLGPGNAGRREQELRSATRSAADRGRA
jgi:hypothetical protein